jgi:hypothetical protein
VVFHSFRSTEASLVVLGKTNWNLLSQLRSTLDLGARCEQQENRAELESKWKSAALSRPQRLSIVQWLAAVGWTAFGEPSTLLRLFFDRANMQSGNSHAAPIIKPYDNPTSLRINSGVLGARDTIPVSAGRDDQERLEGVGVQELVNTRNHGKLKLPKSDSRCKHLATSAVFSCGGGGSAAPSSGVWKYPR